MSMKAYRWARKEIVARDQHEVTEERLSSSEAFVLLMIADHYNDQWARAWPSHTTLARETQLSVTTVKVAIARLVKLGLVEIEKWQMNEGNAWAHNRYLLLAFRPSVRASVDPVIVFADWSDGIGVDYDSILRVPGSNLMIEAADVDLGQPVFR